jgi:hypothetical protein
MGLEKTGATQINLTQIRIIQDEARQDRVCKSRSRKVSLCQYGPSQVFYGKIN